MILAPAWNLIGAQGRFRIPGGRVEYTDVIYNDSTRGDSVRLSRLDATLHQLNRYVDPDQPIEVLEITNHMRNNLMA